MCVLRSGLGPASPCTRRPCRLFFSLLFLGCVCALLCSSGANGGNVTAREGLLKYSADAREAFPPLALLAVRIVHNSSSSTEAAVAEAAATAAAALSERYCLAARQQQIALCQAALNSTQLLGFGFLGAGGWGIDPSTGSSTAAEMQNRARRILSGSLSVTSCGSKAYASRPVTFQNASGSFVAALAWLGEVTAGCACNGNSANSIRIAIPTNDSLLGPDLDPAAGAVETLQARWSGVFGEGPAGGMCTATTGLAPNVTAMLLAAKLPLLPAPDNQQQGPSTTATSTATTSSALLDSVSRLCEAMGSAYPYPDAWGAAVHACTPYTVKCLNTTISEVSVVTLTVRCSVCAGGTQTLSLDIAAPDGAVAVATGPWQVRYTPPTTAESCSVIGDCSGNGCCASAAAIASNRYFTPSGSRCACFNTDLDGHYIGAGCDKCSTSYRTSAAGDANGRGSAPSGSYAQCVVDQQQLVILLTEISTSPLAMTLPLLVVPCLFVCVGLWRRHWDSDQTFAATRRRRAGCSNVIGKIAAVGVEDNAVCGGVGDGDGAESWTHITVSASKANALAGTGTGPRRSTVPHPLIVTETPIHPKIIPPRPSGSLGIVAMRQRKMLHKPI